MARAAASAALGLIGAARAASDTREEGYSDNYANATEGKLIMEIVEIAPIWLALMLVVLVTCELKSKKPIEEGPPWSAIGVAR